MSDPKEQQQDSDDFDLEAETVRDLDVSEDEAGKLGGGQSAGATRPGPTHQPG